MKKTLIIVVFMLVVMFQMYADSEYKIGDIGPAYGIIFYDCDADNDKGNEDKLRSSQCGWRYLEVAPHDVEINGNKIFVFGLQRNNPDGENLFSNGTTDYILGTDNAEDGTCTGVSIGTGAANTVKLVNAMGFRAYSSSWGEYSTPYYAAKVANDFVYGDYDDWFLPSLDELEILYNNLIRNGIGDFKLKEFYWSSSEFTKLYLYDYPADTAWALYTGSGSMDYHLRSSDFRIRCIRAF